MYGNDLVTELFSVPSLGSPKILIGSHKNAPTHAGRGVTVPAGRYHRLGRNRHGPVHP